MNANVLFQDRHHWTLDWVVLPSYNERTISTAHIPERSAHRYATAHGMEAASVVQWTQGAHSFLTGTGQGQGGGGYGMVRIDLDGTTHKLSVGNPWGALVGVGHQQEAGL